jgi:hypothetical protein
MQHSAPDLLTQAEYVTIIFADQKSGKKMDAQTQKCMGFPFSYAPCFGLATWYNTVFEPFLMPIEYDYSESKLTFLKNPCRETVVYFQSRLRYCHRATVNGEPSAPSVSTTKSWWQPAPTSEPNCDKLAARLMVNPSLALWSTR